MLHTLIPLEKIKDELLLKLFMESPPVIHPSMVLIGLYPHKGGNVLWGSKPYTWVTYCVSDSYFVNTVKGFVELNLDRRLSAYKDRAKHYGQTVIRYKLPGYNMMEYYVTSNNRVWRTKECYFLDLENIPAEGETAEETIKLILAKNKKRKKLDFRVVG